MGLENAGIRFTEQDQGSGYRPQSPVQEAVQLLRLRIPHFSGAPPPAAPPGLLAGGVNAPGAMMAGGMAGGMPPALAATLQKVIQALMSVNSQPAGSGGSEAYSPTAALRQILSGQTFNQPSGGYTAPPPQFQYQPAPIYSPQLPYLSYSPPSLSQESLGGAAPSGTPTVFNSGLSGSMY